MRNHTKNRKSRRHPLEICQWCILVHWHMGSCSWSSMQVHLQDGGTLFYRNLFELNLLATAALNHRSATGSSHIPDPLHILSEHRHQIPLSINHCHHQRQRNRPPRLSSDHFQSHQVVGRDPQRACNRRRSVHYSRNPIGSLPSVHPASEVASCHLSLSIFSLSW